MAAAKEECPAQPVPGEGEGPQVHLEVAWIRLEPRYPAYRTRVVDGRPVLLSPETGEPISWEDDAAIRRMPRTNEELTATARVMNLGPASGPFRWEWRVGRQRIRRGEHPGLASPEGRPDSRAPLRLAGVELTELTPPEGSWVDLSCPVRFRTARSVELRLLPVSGSREERTRRAERLDGVSVLALITEAVLRRSGASVAAATLWVQRQLDLVARQLAFAEPVGDSPSRERILRIDQVRVVPDLAAPAPILRAVPELGWDGAWLVSNIPPPESPGERLEELTAVPELRALVVRWLPVPELPNIDVRPEENRARDPDGRPRPPLGFQYVRALTEASGTTFVLSEYTAMAAGRMSGLRSGLPPVQVWDIAPYTRLRVLDNEARPVPAARVHLWQKGPDGIPAEPFLQAETDPQGELVLPNREVVRGPLIAGRFRLADNPFGELDLDGGNGLFLLRVQARGFREWRWLPVTEFNLAHWRTVGNTAILELRTQLPAEGAPPPPQGVRAGWLITGFAVGWSAPAETPSRPIGGYFVYRALPPEYRWQRVGGSAGQKTQAFIPLSDAGGLLARFAVSTVSRDGSESGLAEQPFPER